jgi:acetoin utilization deacetylase AcuC-like enzyme
VHHGNGTQNIFEHDLQVLYASVHQYPYYPGTGAAEEVGAGAGSGYTVNVPVDAGAVDEDYQMIFGEVIVPVLRQFQPDLLLVSAGFDAHGSDPLGQMRLSTEAFAAMTLDLRQVAEECSGGRIACLVEGGYDLRALGESMSAVVDVLAAERAAGFPWPASSKVSPTRGRAAVAAVRQAAHQYWRF